MKKLTVLTCCVLFLLSCLSINAQTVQGEVLKLTSRNSLIPSWNIQYTNLTELEFSRDNNLTTFSMSNTALIAHLPLIANQKIGIGTTLPSEALTISNGFGIADGFLVYGSSNTRSDWNQPWYGLSI